MGDTKERILEVALKLFAQNGFEAVSVSEIAGALGMTKGALYKHYDSKRAIFDSILQRMEQRDAIRAQEYSLPEGTAEEMADKYAASALADMLAYAKAQFRYWTQDDFAADFRRMLTLEQFRSGEQAQLYQQYLASGPVEYMAELFAANGIDNAREAAVAFYAPMFLLYSIYDTAENKAAVLNLLDNCLDTAARMIKA